jgi:hypothetical protein
VTSAAGTSLRSLVLYFCVVPSSLVLGRISQCAAPLLSFSLLFLLDRTRETDESSLARLRLCAVHGQPSWLPVARCNGKAQTGLVVRPTWATTKAGRAPLAGWLYSVFTWLAWLAWLSWLALTRGPMIWDDSHSRRHNQSHGGHGHGRADKDPQLKEATNIVKERTRIQVRPRRSNSSLNETNPKPLNTIPLFPPISLDFSFLFLSLEKNKNIFLS